MKTAFIGLIIIQVFQVNKNQIKLKEISMLYMWQLEKKRPEYRFQTDDKKLADKMKRRQNFILVSIGLNCNHWIFQTSIDRPQNARRMFKHISSGKINYNPNEDVFLSS